MGGCRQGKHRPSRIVLEGMRASTTRESAHCRGHMGWVAWMRKETKKFYQEEEDEVAGLWLVGSAGEVAGEVHDEPVDSRRDEEKGGR